MFYIKTALQSGQCGSEGIFIDRCKEWFHQNYQVQHVFLTPSCTAALEMAALITEINHGDEVIIPSWTHVSTANAFVLRGAKIVFADIDPETMTINTEDVKRKISDRTKAIVAVHYGGYAADVVLLRQLCDTKGIFLIEDAAHSIGAGIKGRLQGIVGHLGCLSFHETKNIQCGEGGALLVNDPRLAGTAEIVFEKGTDRSAFLRGEVSGYEWQRPGSSFAMSNITAAMLLAQLQETESVNEHRRILWYSYRKLLKKIRNFNSLFTLPPLPPAEEEFNAHIFFIKAVDANIARKLVVDLNSDGIQAQFHYRPLHSSPYGSQFEGLCQNTELKCKRLIRLPLHSGMNENQVRRIVSVVEKLVKQK
ncbi:dTDP-4-amino-4,6-dideoxygalactose transaminase [bioreactor metagenome]|uniref:dTDP-4-amino-4,6-dideoxygalactose transaminase n=1 Tax=bioreactor metagenome TaxID=1076179 RepID=A0A644X1J7_9ZZZZ